MCNFTDVDCLVRLRTALHCKWQVAAFGGSLQCNKVKTADIFLTAAPLSHSQVNVLSLSLYSRA